MRNSSYSLIPIFLKLYRYYDHVLKICMWLGYTPQINFCYFFVQFELFFNFQKLSHLESDVPVGGILFHKHLLVHMKFQAFHHSMQMNILMKRRVN